MRFFRSRRLQRILFLLLLVFLGAGPFGFSEQPGDEKGDHVISSPHGFDKLSGQLRQLQIKYGFDVVNVSGVPTLTKTISIDYIPGTSYDPLSTDFLTYPERGPPLLITML